jgi:nicotinamide-nucleotide amidase
MSASFDALADDAAALLEACRRAGVRLTTAESCTGGLIAAALTEVPGSSDVFERGFITYSNTAKTELLGVPSELIEQQGAVSEEVACAMATGALKHSQADIAVAVTGIAGPGGGTPAKPVGLVYIGTARRHEAARVRELRLGDVGRAAIRRATVVEAFALVQALLKSV